MPLNRPARASRTWAFPVKRCPQGSGPFGKSKEQSSEKNSMMASRSWRLNASRICFNVSTVTGISFELTRACVFYSVVLLLQADIPQSQVNKTMMNIFDICIYFILVISCTSIAPAPASCFTFCFPDAIGRCRSCLPLAACGFLLIAC